MARPSNTHTRRAEIVRGLVQVMGRHGWEGASVARIAKAARLTPGLVHYHFTDKREILLEAVGALETRVGERVQRRLAAAPASALARLDAFVDAHLAPGRDADPDAVACWVAIAAESVRDVRVRQALDAALRRMAAQLEALFGDSFAEKGRARSGARSAAAAVVSSILGALVVASSAPGLIPAGSAASSVKALAHALVHEHEGGA